MRFFYFFIIFLALTKLLFSGVKEVNPNLFYAMGYIDKQGIIVIPPKELNGEFRASLGEGMWKSDNGVEDSCGNVVFSSNGYEIGEVFKSKLLRIRNRQSGLWGYINIKGKWVIKPKYNMADDFNENLACVSDGASCIVINPKGRELFRLFGIQGGFFSDGLLKTRKVYEIQKNNYKAVFGFYDKNGKLKIDFKYDYVSNFINNRAIVRKNGTYYIIDKNEKIISEVAINIQSVGNGFSNGLLLVENEDSKYGYINEKGVYVIPPIYNVAFDFSKGLALVSSDYAYLYPVDKSGTFSVSMFDFPLYKFIDSWGKDIFVMDKEFIIQNGYIGFRPFNEEGIALFFIENPLFSKKIKVGNSIFKKKLE